MDPIGAKDRHHVSQPARLIGSNRHTLQAPTVSMRILRSQSLRQPLQLQIIIDITSIALLQLFYACILQTEM